MPDKFKETEQKPKWVKTAGMMSDVETYAEIRGENVPIGHVTFMDFEDTELKEIQHYIHNKTDLTHVFVFESSEGNYHGINVAIRSLAEVIDVKSSIAIDDGDHLDIGMKKGRYTIRLAEKGDKGRPEHVYTYADRRALRSMLYSHIHLSMLQELYDIPLVNTIMDECRTVGESMPITRYNTRENNHELDGDNNG